MATQPSDDAVIVGADHVVEVAAYVRAGQGAGAQRKAGHGGKIAGNDALLDGGGNLHLLAHQGRGLLGFQHPRVFHQRRGFGRDGVQDVPAHGAEIAGLQTAVEIKQAEQRA